jgi:hypothetical protein
MSTFREDCICTSGLVRGPIFSVRCMPLQHATQCVEGLFARHQAPDAMTKREDAARRGDKHAKWGTLHASRPPADPSDTRRVVICAVEGGVNNFLAPAMDMGTMQTNRTKEMSLMMSVAYLESEHRFWCKPRFLAACAFCRFRLDLFSLFHTQYTSFNYAAKGRFLYSSRSHCLVAPCTLQPVSCW